MPLRIRILPDGRLTELAISPAQPFDLGVRRKPQTRAAMPAGQVALKLPNPRLRRAAQLGEIDPCALLAAVTLDSGGHRSRAPLPAPPIFPPPVHIGLLALAMPAADVAFRAHRGRHGSSLAPSLCPCHARDSCAASRVSGSGVPLYGLDRLC